MLTLLTRDYKKDKIPLIYNFLIILDDQKT